MVQLWALLVAARCMHSAVALLDVPLGECHACEVTCFADCTLKYEREVMKDDFLQLAAQKQNATTNETVELTTEYTKCLEEEKCPCKSQTAGKAKALELVDKKKTRCAVGEVPCAAKCAKKVGDNDIARLTKQVESNSTVPAKSFLQSGHFPIHSVKINAFAKGAMTLDSCFKYCLAATCGCDDAPGIDTIDALTAAIKQNDKAQGTADTKPSKQWRPATMKECAKGMPGKKVSKGMYVKMGGGPGGMYEICAKDMLGKVLGAGDHSAVIKRCKSGAAKDAKFGCVWDNQKKQCQVGFSPIMRCQTQYYDDKTL